ncbi:hypothetical protein [Halomontanus rarus]|uniref:hypothetical protein n=1 Tax=Halomontanus rarus TaxID=3034020 RepID=UPI001A9A0096
MTVYGGESEDDLDFERLLTDAVAREREELLRQHALKEEQLEELVEQYVEERDRIKEALRPAKRRARSNGWSRGERQRRAEEEVAELYEQLEACRGRFVQRKQDLEDELARIEQELSAVEEESEILDDVVADVLDK